MMELRILEPIQPPTRLVTPKRPCAGSQTRTSSGQVSGHGACARQCPRNQPIPPYIPRQPGSSRMMPLIEVASTKPRSASKIWALTPAAARGAARGCGRRGFLAAVKRGPDKPGPEDYPVSDKAQRGKTCEVQLRLGGLCWRGSVEKRPEKKKKQTKTKIYLFFPEEGRRGPKADSPTSAELDQIAAGKIITLPPSMRVRVGRGGRRCSAPTTMRPCFPASLAGGPRILRARGCVGSWGVKKKYRFKGLP